MRSFILPPLIALLSVIAGTIVLGWPAFSALSYIVDENSVTWFEADSELWPRRPFAGEHTETLRNADTVNRTSPRQYSFYVGKPLLDGAPYAVFLPRTAPKTKAYVNMLGVSSSIYESRNSLLFAEIPASELRRTSNRIDIIVPATGPLKAPRSILFGPAQTIRQFAKGYIGFLFWSIIYAMGFGFSSAFFGFVSAAFLPHRLSLAVPSMISLLLAASLAFALFDWPPEESQLQPWLGWVSGTLSANFLLMMLASEAQPWKTWVTIAFRAATVGACLLVFIAFVSISIPATASALGHDIATATTMLSASVSLWLAVAGPAKDSAWSDAQRAIAAVIAFSLLAAAISGIEVLGGITQLTAAMFSFFPLVVGLGAFFIWTLASLYQDFERLLQSRFGLSRIVREQQAQLEAQREEIQRAAVNRAVLEERERFSRDVHDGVGGTLVSLLIQARRGALREEALEMGLQQTLADLRLMIDALDHSHASLSAAFSTFRTRVAPTFAATHIELDWRQADLQQCALCQPSHLLYIFRILQEACTNALRHAKATRVAVVIRWNRQAHALALEVTDNGTGGTVANAGNGLRNMSERAEKIGATFTAGPLQDATGWQVRLIVPVK